MRFKPNDILYCRSRVTNTGLSRSCVVRVTSTEPEHGKYYVDGLTDGACTAIHEICCAGTAVLVSERFVEYLHLFGLI